MGQETGTAERMEFFYVDIGKEKYMKERFQALITEGRSFRERLFMILPVSLFFALLVFFFAPSEYLLTNYSEFWFSSSQIWWCFLLLTFGCFFFLTGIGILLKGKLFNIYITALFALALALYLEGNFIGADYGIQTGQEIRWERYGTFSFLNTAEWCMILLVPFMILYMFPKFWRFLVKGVSLILSLMFLVTIACVILMDPDCVENPLSSLGFSWNGFDTASKNENTLVILVDEWDTKYAEEQMIHDADCMDFLKGFTYYPDTVSVYNMTYPAVTQYFTGKMWYMEDLSVEEYDRLAWQQDELFSGLKEKNADIRIFGDRKDFAAVSNGLIDNAAEGTPSILSYSGLLKDFFRLVAFRYLPHGLKAGVWITADNLDAYADRGNLFSGQNSVVYEYLKEHPLKAVLDVPTFRFCHIRGMHPPFIENEECQCIGDGATSYTEGQAVLRILEAMMQQLEDAGIYDSTAVIIVADHGTREERLAPITEAHNPVLMIKPRRSRDPFAVSAEPRWTTYMKPTMMDAAGLDNYSEFGHSLLRPEENPWEFRYHYAVVTADLQNELVEYLIHANAAYMNAWKETGKTWHLGTYYFND